MAASVRLLVLGLSSVAVLAIGCGDDDPALREPVQIATGQARPGPLVVDAQGVHWINAGDGAVMSLATGEAAPVELATVEGGASDAVSDADRIYWTATGDAGAVAWVQKHGGDVHELTSGEGRLSAIALDETCVYWSSDKGTVRTMWKDGGEIASVAEDQPSPVGVERDASGIFWLAGAGETVVRRAKQLGDPVTDAAAAAGTAGQLVVRNAEVFWTVTTPQGGAAVWSSSADGGDARELGQGPAAPVALALGSAAVYWADAGGAIWQVPRSGGATEQLAALDRPAADLAFSSDFLFGSDPGAGAQDGAVWKVSVLP